MYEMRRKNKTKLNVKQNEKTINRKKEIKLKTLLKENTKNASKCI